MRFLLGICQNKDNLGLKRDGKVKAGKIRCKLMAILYVYWSQGRAIDSFREPSIG